MYQLTFVTFCGGLPKPLDAARNGAARLAMMRADAPDHGRQRNGKDERQLPAAARALLDVDQAITIAR